MADRAPVGTPKRGALILQWLKQLVAFREFALSVVLIVMGATRAFASPVFSWIWVTCRRSCSPYPSRQRSPSG